jgi:hypothetical protein
MLYVSVVGALAVRDPVTFALARLVPRDARAGVESAAIMGGVTMTVSDPPFHLLGELSREANPKPRVNRSTIPRPRYLFSLCTHVTRLRPSRPVSPLAAMMAAWGTCYAGSELSERRSGFMSPLLLLFDV